MFLCDIERSLGYVILLSLKTVYIVFFFYQCIALTLISSLRPRKDRFIIFFGGGGVGWGGEARASVKKDKKQKTNASLKITMKKTTGMDRLDLNIY